jgi:Periplasmic binding protein-like domain
MPILLDNVGGMCECVHNIYSDRGTAALPSSPARSICGPAASASSVKKRRCAKPIFPWRRAASSRGSFVVAPAISSVKQVLAQASQSARPSAIFACNGVMILGLLKALEELNIRCPEEIALATFDNLAGKSPFHRHLTAVVQPS